MREIKFRAWDGEKMYYMVELTLDGWVHSWGDYGDNTECIAIGSTRENSPLKRAYVMQYTGLKDKNGNEIYEGDIVKVVERKRGAVREGELGVVEWVGTGFSCRSLPPDDWDAMAPTFSLHLAQLEVIGNIYEDKGLLK